MYAVAETKGFFLFSCIILIFSFLLYHVINFADSAWRLHVPASTDAGEIWRAAAEGFQQSEFGEERVVEEVVMLFMDEEAMFDMPGLLVNTAEGLLLSPPHWDDMESNIFEDQQKVRSTMAAIPRDHVCASDHDANAIACVKCMHTNFKRQLLFKKRLSRSDLNRIYLRPSYVSKICPAAIESERTRIELLFYDPDMTPWPMSLKNTTGKRWRLIGKWSRFVREKKLSIGQKIKFYEYKCNKSGTDDARFFMINVRRRVFGRSLARRRRFEN